MHEKLKAVFQHFPASEFWRFHMEATRQNEGPLAFEKEEQGYMAAMQNAFDWMLSEEVFEQPLTTDLIIQLRQHATKGVNESFEDGFRDNEETAYEIIFDPENPDCNATPEGMLELLGFMQKEFQQDGKCPVSYRIVYTDQGQQLFDKEAEDFEPNSTLTPGEVAHKLQYAASGTMDIDSQPASEIRNKFDEAITRYHGAIGSAESDIEKIDAICRLCHELEARHGFDDANCRTIPTLLLIRECLKNNLPPPIVSNPNRFDGYSVQQLTEEVTKGFAVFQAYSIKEIIDKFQDTPIAQSSAEELDGLFSKDNQIALAQINAIYLKILTNEMTLKTEKNPSIMFTDKGQEKSRSACLSVLKELYKARLRRLNVSKQMKSPSALLAVSKKHRCVSAEEAAQALNRWGNQRAVKPPTPGFSGFNKRRGAK